MEFFATASIGTEKALQDELIELGFKSASLRTAEVQVQQRTWFAELIQGDWV